MRIGILVWVGCAAALTLSGCEFMSTTTETGMRSDWTAFGAQPMGPGDAVEVASLTGGEQLVVVHGVITGVSQANGEWMTIRDDNGDEIFVRFKDNSVAIPHGAAGRNVVVHGQTERQIASVEELRRCADEANRKPGEINAISQPRERITLYADSVLIAGDGLDQQ